MTCDITTDNEHIFSTWDFITNDLHPSTIASIFAKLAKKKKESVTYGRKSLTSHRMAWLYTPA